MARTRLFHTVVIVGAGLLAGCEKGPAPMAKKDGGVKDAQKLAPQPPLIDAAQPVRIMAAPPDARIMAAPPPVRIMIAPPPPRIQVRRKTPWPPKVPRI
ncbi:MAG TPA: hypothetical protein VL326_02555 [Kofleriaceae bacterium]|nr:hypothetical protein [Kofleriaceae bacterium]